MLVTKMSKAKMIGQKYPTHLIAQGCFVQSLSDTNNIPLQLSVSSSVRIGGVKKGHQGCGRVIIWVRITQGQNYIVLSLFFN